MKTKHKLPIQFPSRTPSKMVLFKVLETPNVGTPYYFDEDKQLEHPGLVITGIKFNYYVPSSPTQGCLPSTWQTDQTVYNVAIFQDLRTCYLTLIDKDGDVKLDAQPCSTFNTFPFEARDKYLRRYYLENIALKASFIQFTFPAIATAPFIIPFEFFYRDTKR